jgi:hypothetical protein
MAQVTTEMQDILAFAKVSQEAVLIVKSVVY